MGRQYVHFSIDTQTALAVGQRKSATPLLLEVDAVTAFAEGVLFYEGNSHVWLADQVAARYLSVVPTGSGLNNGIYLQGVMSGDL